MSGDQPATGAPFLDGVRVLDLSRVLAGPLATQILADMGADVLKVEPPAGDDTRRWGPPFVGDDAAYFHSCNRNKASLVLDLKEAGGRATLERLAAVADVVVDNYPPAVRRRLGVTPDDLRRHNPNLVTLTITGYSGERADDPGYDLVIQAESGLMGITGPEDGTPHKVGVAMVDVLTGMMGANGLLGALVRRGRTGEGADLSISLFRTALFSLVNVAANYLATGEASGRWGNRHPNLAPYELFEAVDGPLVIGIGNAAQFRRLGEVLGLDLPDLDNRGRLEAREEIAARIERVTASSPRDELLRRLTEARIPAAPVLRPDEAISRGAGWDPDTVVAVAHDQRATIDLVALPLLTPTGLRRGVSAPPALGEGGEAAVTRWLG